MREILEHTTPTPDGLTEKEYPERLTSPEEEITEVGLILKRAKTEVKEFGASGLQRAEEVALEIGTKVDEETKAALIELGKEAELASQMLGDTLVGYLRIKRADFLEKNLPKSRLTEIVKRRNKEIISKKVVRELEKFLEKIDLNYFDLDYSDADQAAEYFEKYKDLLIEEDRKYLESRVQEVVRFYNQRKAEALSKKIINELQKLLKYDYDNKDYPKAMEAVKFFIRKKESIALEERPYLERRVFGAIEAHLTRLASDRYIPNAWENALYKYDEIPNEFFVDKDIQIIGYQILFSASPRLTPPQLMDLFEGNLDLLSAGSRRYGNDYDGFSPKQRVRMIEETYKKRGPSEYIAKYKVSEFDDNDKEKVLKPLFESYMAFRRMEILSQIEKMRVFYDQLSHEDRNDLVKNWIADLPIEVADNIDFLNLNEEQKKLLVESLLQNKRYEYLFPEVRMKKLGINKEQFFNELLKNNAALLFVYREVFNLSPEQHKLLMDRVTSDPKELEKTLEEIFYNHYSDEKTLTEKEIQAFQSALEKGSFHLVFRFKRVFEDTYKQKRDQFFKDLPKSIPVEELDRFVEDVDNGLGGWEKNTERVQVLIAEAGEQKVTLEYIEYLDKLGLKLPNRVTGQIRENVIKAEQRYLLYYIWYALKKNSSLEQIQREQLKKLENIISNADYFKAVHLDVLRYVLKDRRFKTQFETHTSGGALNPRYRASKEGEMFNYDIDVSKNKRVRPNYGYMSDNPHGLVGYFSENYINHSNVGHYGRVHIKFIREKVQNRTTVTFNDSLDFGDRLTPTPSIMPHFSSIDASKLSLNFERASQPQDWGSYYLEVQYHWPLKTEVIDSIHISTKNGLSETEMEEIEELVREYNNQYPDRQIKVVKY